MKKINLFIIKYKIYILCFMIPSYIIIEYTLFSKLIHERLYDAFIIEIMLLQVIIQGLPLLLLFILLIYIIKSMMKYIQQKLLNRVDFFIAILIFIICVLFFDKFLFLHEIILFNFNQEKFTQIVDIGKKSKCYTSHSTCQEYMEIPFESREIFRNEFLGIISQSNSITIITIIGRGDLYFAYSPDLVLHEDIRVYTAQIKCFHNFGSGWFLCNIKSTN